MTQSLSCRELIDFLLDYLECRLSPEARAAFHAHLAVCPDCVHYIEAYTASVRAARLAFEPEDGPLPDDVPEELVDAILAARRRGAD